MDPISTTIPPANFLSSKAQSSESVPNAVAVPGSNVNSQRIHTTEELTSISCPRCNSATHFAYVSGLKVVACRLCGGFLTQSRDFAGLIEVIRRDFRGVEVSVRLNAAQLEQALACPTCFAVMETHPYAGPGAVVIDSCRHCATVWLDGGELEKIEQSPGKR